ncbi:General stress protein 16O [Novipirellula galeiformis]|uniref:General stress protein 16O n=1 Tax=Novipirellula galeiformis TaxID=2528004 RepID=A0A5C6CQL1_9BACT|nr:TraR/DksA family transcriptional regulator [Novipirellula galeiformis]TWU26215.1 General stress protein 16O [Novipirellula galeiformis]
MKSDYTELRAELEEKLRELIVRAQNIDNDLRKPGDEDWEERASETESDEVLASVGNLALNEIEKIKHALRQIDDGSYGKCARCGKKIPKARLKAIPYASTCTACA